MNTVDVRRVIAAALAVAGVVGLAGWAWACIVAALGVLVVAPRTPTARRDVWGMLRARVRPYVARMTSWATPDSLSAVLVPVGIIGLATGVGVAEGVGVGLAVGFGLIMVVGVVLEAAPRKDLGR